MPGPRLGWQVDRMTLDLTVRGGLLYDGSGAPPYRADLGIEGDRVVVVGELPQTDAPSVDATGLAVTPGFVNVLSHAWGSLQTNGAGHSDVLQGVTTEVFGEAVSLGPTPPELMDLVHDRNEWAETRVDFDRLSEGLGHLEKSGVTMNVASFLGGHNLRALGAGLDNRPLTAAEIDRLRGVVDEEMADGALGIGTALIYAPGNYASTDELVALCEVVGRHDGLYISHMRSEGDSFLECLEELIGIGQRASCRAEVYHLKAAGTANHPKMKQAIERIDRARDAGQRVSANMYPYTAGSTALVASIPPAYHSGGMAALLDRLADATVRAEVIDVLKRPSKDFENLFLGAGAGEGCLLLADLADGTPAAGRFLTDVGADLGIDDPFEALLRVVRSDPGMSVAYFMMSEDNVELGLSQPWVSVGSDAEALDVTTAKGPTHPRTYGTFARVLGHYSRDRALFPLEEAVRRMTSLPADTLRLTDRGRLAVGSYADLVVLDPATVADTATYENPHSYATGVHHVVVNGAPVVRDGAVLDARPGRHLRRSQL
jgi:N-acyl-D-amino-acid deacylase